MNNQPERMAYTVKEVATMLSLSRSHLYELIQARKIDTIKIGRARRITRRQLDLYLAEREIEAS